MTQFVTRGIVLARTNYGEADRILTFLTPNHGKLKVIAKGVRKAKSKLAGGIELFSISDLTVIKGKSEINTLVSSRLFKNYSNIVKDLERTEVAYEAIRLTNKSTEEYPEETYFNLLKLAFEALDDVDLDPKVTGLWFKMQLLKLAGHTPNLHTNQKGGTLTTDKTYDFLFDEMCFMDSTHGSYSVNHIKFMRLGFASIKPHVLHSVRNNISLQQEISPLVQSVINVYVKR
jgi:DNA repair protein RecO (recombination protein O)